MKCETQQVTNQLILMVAMMYKEKKVLKHSSLDFQQTIAFSTQKKKIVGCQFRAYNKNSMCKQMKFANLILTNIFII